MSRRTPPDPRNPVEPSRPGAYRNRDDYAELAAIIDQAATGKPTLSAFLERLQARGVTPVPSMQSSGRLNGMSYQFQGAVIKGSAIGRAYTAQGLQQRQAVDYLPLRDDATLRDALLRAQQHREPQAKSQNSRRDRVRDAHTRLSPDQGKALEAIGKFRTVSVHDLGGDRMGRLDVQGLIDRGLAQKQKVNHIGAGTSYEVVFLTKPGRTHLRKLEAQQQRQGPRQEYYAGFVKPAEVAHDIGVSRMFRMEKDRLELAGATIQRVVLDYELKRKVFSEMNRPGGTKQGAASKYDIKIVDGKLVFPDLRIEYENRDLQQDKVDLELTTGHYKASQVAAKQAAGFTFYRSDCGGLSISGPDSAPGSVSYDPEHIADLISL